MSAVLRELSLIVPFSRLPRYVSNSLQVMIKKKPAGRPVAAPIRSPSDSIHSLIRPLNRTWFPPVG